MKYTQKEQSWLVRRILAAGFLTLAILLPTTVPAQTVTWGLGGAGGAGTWDTATLNWFDGLNDVAWPSGGDAIFAGAAGGTVTVDSSTAGPVVSSILFDRQYVLDGGTISGGASGLAITTNAPTTINSSLSGPGSVLVKNGPATLELSNAPEFDAVHVDQGELRIVDQFTTIPEVRLANAPGATLSLNSPVSLAGLSGGGPAGGVVTAGNVRVLGDGEFNGQIQRAAPSFDGDFRLTAASPYTGATRANGQLTFAGSGSALNSPMSVSGTLVLDNRDTALNNRISDTLPVTIDGGNLRLEGNAFAPVEELLGELVLPRSSTVTVNSPVTPAAAQLTFAGVQREGQATLNVVGPGVKIAGLANGSTGIVAPYVTAGSEWAIIGPDDRIAPLSNYSTDINSGSATDHVKLSGAGSTVLAGDTTRASLNLQNGPGLQSAAQVVPTSTASQVLDLNGHNLELTSGGVLSTGASPSAVRGGSLSTPAAEMVITARNDFEISSSIVDGGGPTMLTKSGAGTLTLSGANTYTGPTTVVEGTLLVAADANLGAGSSIAIQGGRLQAAASFSSSKGFASGLGMFDTGGFDVEFSGASTGSLRKTGAGRLTLSGQLPNWLYVLGGEVELPNAGDEFNLFAATLIEGTLQADGVLATLIAIPEGAIPVLDIGGPAAATLLTSLLVVGERMQVNFGLGSANSDLWEVSIFGFTGEEKIQFAFHNLGDVSPGVDYPLISNLGRREISAELFAIAPESIAAGWAGEFTATREGVSIRFSAVPEPSLLALLLLPASALLWNARRLRQRRRGTPGDQARLVETA